jgi:broad specificity phosphatase PhoE
MLAACSLGTWSPLQSGRSLILLTGMPFHCLTSNSTFCSLQGTAWHFEPPGGESQRQVEQRMAEFLTHRVLPSLTPEAPAIVVGHGMAIKCLLRGVLSSLPTMSRSIATGNTSITELGFVPSPTAHNGSSNATSSGNHSGGKGGSVGINATLAGCGGSWHILRVNDLSHLPFDLRS